MNKKSITLDELKQFCIEYDKINGEYPEHEFEGLAVYDYIYTKLTHKTVTVAYSPNGLSYDIVEIDDKGDENE